MSLSRSPHRWRLMRAGLLLLIWGMVLYLVATVLRVPLQMAQAGGGLGGPGPAAPAAGLIVLGLSLASLLLVLIGIGLCCTIPSEAGAGGWVVGVILAIVCYILEFIGLVAWMVMVLMGMGWAPGLRGFAPGWGFLGILGLIVLTMFIGSLSLTMVFRAAALYWDDRNLAKNFVSYFILSWILPLAFGVAFAALLAISADAPRRGGMGAEGGVTLVFGCVFLIFALVMFIWGLTLLGRLRQVIPTASGRPYDEED